MRLISLLTQVAAICYIKEKREIVCSRLMDLIDETERILDEKNKLTQLVTNEMSKSLKDHYEDFQSAPGPSGSSGGSLSSPVVHEGSWSLDPQPSTSTGVRKKTNLSTSRESSGLTKGIESMFMSSPKKQSVRNPGFQQFGSSSHSFGGERYHSGSSGLMRPDPMLSTLPDV